VTLLDACLERRSGVKQYIEAGVDPLVVMG